MGSLPGLSLPGLSLATSTPLSSHTPSQSNNHAHGPSNAPPRTEELPPRSELRFEVSQHNPYTLRLLRGTAELFGTELAPSTNYVVPAGTKGAVFTWHGCAVEVQGECESEYVGQETDAMVEWMNVHGMLETMRDDAAAAGGGDDNAGGPRVLVVGPDNAGKTSLVKCLVAWALKSGRTPTLVNLDPREGVLAPPSALTAATVTSLLDPEDSTGGWGTSPISGPTLIPVKTPLVYHFPFASPDEKAGMFRPLVTRAALAVTSRLEEDAEAKNSGLIIDTPGTLNSPKAGYELIAHIVSEFSINILLTLGSERLYNDMVRRFANPKSAVEDTVHVFRISTTGGAVARDEGYMRLVRQQQIKTYFFGTSGASLNPHGQWWDFSELSIYKAVDASSAGGAANPSFLPGMDDDEGGDGGHAAGKHEYSSSMLEKVAPNQGMINGILAIKFCAGNASQDSIRDSCVLGFVYVAEVDETRKRVRFLAPHPSRWGDRALVWGNWPEGVGDLVA